MNHLTASRISWVDICRGIAIFLVLYGHALQNEAHRILIYAFHMPLFFFLSGIVFRLETSKPIISIIRKNVKTILLPYVLFAILTFLASYFLLQNQTYTWESFTKQVYGVFYGNGNQGYLAFNVALWFLPCLFLTKVFFSFITRATTNTKILITLLVVFSLIGYYFSSFQQSTKLFFGFETAFTAIVFFGAGYLWNQNEKVKLFFTNRKLLILLLAVTLTIIFGWLNFHFHEHQIDMRVNRLNNYFFFYIAAFSGIITAITVSMFIKKNSSMEYLGQQSLILFVWHTVLFTFFRQHNLPPFKVEFITPLIHVFEATIIILLGKMLLDYLKRKMINEGSTSQR